MFHLFNPYLFNSQHYKAVLAVFLFAIYLGCTSGENDNFELPFVEFENISVEEIDIGKALFRANLIIKEGEIRERGFVISSSISNPDINNFDDRIEILKPSEISGFDTTWVTEFPSFTYYVRAYAIVADDRVERPRTIYSEEEKFSLSGGVKVLDSIDFLFNDSVRIEGVLVKLTRQVAKHGHVISTNTQVLPTISNSITSNLGPESDDGSFFSSFNDLNFNSKYLVRSYVITEDGRDIYSDTTSFQTKDGWKTKSKWNGQSQFRIGRDPIQLSLAVSDGHQAYVGVGCKQICGVSFGLHNDIYGFQPNLESSFLNHSDFNSEARIHSVNFILRDTIYYGLGVLDGDKSYFKDFYHHDESSNSWVRIQDFPGEGGRFGAVAFVYDGYAYVGAGRSASGDYLNDFYRFNPGSKHSKNAWDTIASLPLLLRNRSNLVRDRGRVNAVGFSIDGLGGFAGSGYDGLRWQKDFWRYDVPTNTWRDSTLILGSDGFSRASAFVIDEIAYIIAGYSNGSVVNEMWAFDPLNISGIETWTSRILIQGQPRYYAKGFALNGKGYILFGETCIFDGNCDSESKRRILTDIWEYTPLVN